MAIDKSQSGSVSDQLKEELLLLLANQSIRVPVVMTLIGATMVYIVYGRIPNTFLWAWIFVFSVVLILRWYLFGFFAKRSDIPVDIKIGVEAVLIFISGVVHAAPLLAFSEFTTVEQAMISMFIVALCAGAVFTNAGYMPFFLSYATPLLIALAVSWGLSSISQWDRTPIVFLLIGYGGLLYGSARDSFKLFVESFEIRLQKNELNQKLQLALAEAEQSNVAKTRFLASASHDLRQPVQALVLYISALSMRNLDEESNVMADRMNIAVRSLSNQLDSLLDISRLDAGVVKPEFSKMDMGELIEQICLDIEPLASKKLLDLVVNIPEHCYVYSDQRLLERIIRNVLDNAIKYTERGFIRLHIEDKKTKYVLRIEDSGSGVPSEQQNQIFEEFYQLQNPERDRTKGLGLGLSIVKRLCRLLEINMNLDSEIDRGTVFEFMLEKTQQTFASFQKEEIQPTSLNGLDILVIDDEVSVATAMQVMLESRDGTARWAGDIDMALDLATERKPDILISDFRLRGTENGISAIEQLREIYPNLPAILISGDTAPDRLIQAEKAGITFLSKPVRADELVLTISQQVSST